jgi:hypothetical protein
MKQNKTDFIQKIEKNIGKIKKLKESFFKLK